MPRSFVGCALLVLLSFVNSLYAEAPVDPRRPAARADRQDAASFPSTFRQPWHTPEYLQLLRNAIGWHATQSNR